MTIVAEPLLDASDRARLSRKLQGERFVLGKRPRDELRQSDRLQQTRRDATRKRRPDASQERKAGPQRIAPRRVRIPWLRVEKQIGKSMASEVIGGRHLRREHETLGRHAKIRRFA